MYGKSRGAKGFTSRRTGGVFNANFNRALRKVGNKYVSKKGKGGTGIRFATVGYTRDVEKKYCDRSFISRNYSVNAITIDGGNIQGIKFSANQTWVESPTPQGSGTNLVSGIVSGTTANSRIGNKVTVKSLDIGIIMEAAKTPAPMNGEIVNNETPLNPAQEYMKTAYRIVLVKDKQVNNNTNNITWDDVFGDQGTDGYETGNIAFASTSKLKVSNMGRFEIVRDIRVQLDGDDPMKTINFVQYINKNIRFNSNEANALSDVGYYLVVAQDVLGTASTSARVLPGNFRVNSRNCFTDA